MYLLTSSYLSTARDFSFKTTTMIPVMLKISFQWHVLEIKTAIAYTLFLFLIKSNLVQLTGLGWVGVKTHAPKKIAVEM